MEASKINLCVVDDHQIFRKALCQLVNTFPRIASVLEAENGAVCLEVVAHHKPDVVLLDLEMPVMNGVDCAEQLIQKHPDVKIIILTMHDSEKYILHMIELGVHSFLLKNTNPSELQRAIYGVVDKDFYHNHLLVSVIRKSMRSKLKSTRPDFAGGGALTDRENEILRLICQERSIKDVAQLLNISEKTVHSHKINIQHKLGVKTTIGMVRAAYENGLID